MGMASVCFALLEVEDCIIKDLVERLGIPNGTMSGLLDRLEKVKIIKRAPCKTDRRAKRISLTKKGRSLENPMRDAHQKANAIVEANLSKKEVKELKRLLQIVRQSIDESADCD